MATGVQRMKGYYKSVVYNVIERIVLGVKRQMDEEHWNIIDIQRKDEPKSIKVVFGIY